MAEKNVDKLYYGVVCCIDHKYSDNSICL